MPKAGAEELAKRTAQDFDGFYASRSEGKSPEGEEKVGEECADLIVLSSDGKGVVVRHEDLRAATRKKAEESKHRLSKRLSR